MKLIHFEKKLNLPGAIAVTIGGVIGVGIFVIVGPIGAKSGVYMPVVFLIATLPAIFGTIVSIALGSTIPADGGGYYYAKSLLGKKTGAVASFLVVFGAMGALMAVSMGVADYLLVYFPSVPRPLLAMILILVSWGVNSLGVSASVGFQVVMVVQMVSALLLILVAGVLGGGNPVVSGPLPAGVGGFLEAVAIAGLTYTGFNIIGELGDEVENPHRNIPITITVGLGVVAILYIGISWVVAGSLSVEQLKVSKVALLDTAMIYLPGWCAHYLNIGAATAAVTSINAVFLAVPREFNALAEDGVIGKWIAKFDPKRQTFPRGIALIALGGTALCLPNFKTDTWGLVCVAGIFLANTIFSVGVFRLFKLYPKQVAEAPIKISRWWLFPAGVLSAVMSFAFTALSIISLRAILPIILASSALAVYLAREKPSTTSR